MSDTEAESIAAGNAQLADSPCRYCGTVGQIRLEFRDEFIFKPLGTFSLAGAQMKASAKKVRWPWAKCHACGHESKGKR